MLEEYICQAEELLFYMELSFTTETFNFRAAISGIKILEGKMFFVMRIKIDELQR